VILGIAAASAAYGLIVAISLSRHVTAKPGVTVCQSARIARQVLDRLLSERIDWTPKRDEGLYEYSGRLQFDRLLQGIVLTDGQRKSQSSRPPRWSPGAASA